VDWLALFEQEQVEFAVLDRRADSDLIRMLRRQHGWTVDFKDEESVIFVRNRRAQHMGSS